MRECGQHVISGFYRIPCFSERRWIDYRIIEMERMEYKFDAHPHQHLSLNERTDYNSYCMDASVMKHFRWQITNFVIVDV